MAPAGRRVRFGAVAGAAAVLGALPVAPALAAPAGGQPADY